MATVNKRYISREFNLHCIWLQTPRPIALRPFKLNSEMEFFYATKFFNFFRGGQVPPLPIPVGAHGTG